MTAEPERVVELSAAAAVGQGLWPLAVWDRAAARVRVLEPNLLWEAAAVGAPVPTEQLTEEERAYAARPENRYGRWVTIDGRRVFIRGTAPLPERVLRALHTHKPVSALKYAYALRSEQRVAKILGAKNLDDNEPMDVVGRVGSRLYGVEVKTFTDNTNNKVTVHPDSLRRKLSWARKERAALHTVVVDARREYDGGKHSAYYSGSEMWYSAGVGSFRLSSMTPVRDAAHLRALILGETRSKQYAVDREGYKGRWVTIKGRHVFIRSWETPKEALARSLREEKWRREKRESAKYNKNPFGPIPDNFLVMGSILYGKALSARYSWVHKGRPAMSKAVRRYTGLEEGSFYEYEDLNKQLRRGRVSGEMKKWAPALDSAFRGNKLDRDITLYRGVLLSKDQVSKLKVGTVMRDKGFVSTSVNPFIALDFTGSRRGRTLFEIHARKGTPAIKIGNTSELLEEEVLLPRNLKFKVLGQRRVEGIVKRQRSLLEKEETKPVTIVSLEIVP